MITPGTSDDNPNLKSAIAGRIQAEGRITFSDFMEMALYYPDEGYYTNRRGLIGARGDFYTSPHLTPVFGEMLARQMVEMWRNLGTPSDFTIVEMGAGQGLLVADILGYILMYEPDCWQALNYRVIEISPKLREAQALRLKHVPAGPALLEKVSWGKLEEIAPESLTGCVFSNELVDAFPVHLVTILSGQLKEIYVKLDAEGNFTEEVGEPSDPALAEFFKEAGVDLSTYDDGYRTEVNLKAGEWLATVASRLKQGYILTVDYGYETASRYHPRRADGTLQCYYNHRVHGEPYINLGRQDITAHVDFSDLLRAGEKANLSRVGLVTQTEFLLGLGLGEKLAELSQPEFVAASGLPPAEILARREALQRLILPTRLGNFRVLLQGKNLPPGQKLSGLTYAR